MYYLAYSFIHFFEFDTGFFFYKSQLLVGSKCFAAALKKFESEWVLLK